MNHTLVIEDDDWNNHISSFKIQPGCNLRLYDVTGDFSEDNKIYEYTNNAKTIYKEDKSFWSNHRLNDKVGSVQCQCGFEIYGA